MGQNSDIHNIFESYSKKVLLKEQLSGVLDIPQLEKRLETIKDEKDRKPLLDRIAELKNAQTSSNNATPQPAAPATPTPTATTAPTNTEPVRLSRSPAPKPTTPQQAPVADVSKSTSNPYAKKVAQPAAAPTTPQSTKTTDYDETAEQYGLNASNNFGGDVNLQGANPYGDNTNKADFSNINNAGGTKAIDKNPLQLQPDANIQTPQPTTNTKGAKTSGGGGGSIVDYLAGKNEAFDKASRGKLAAQYGIQNYTGTAEQNAQLLNKLKADEKMPQGTNATGEKQYATGTVPKAPANEPQQQPQQQQGMGGIIGGASKLAGGAGNLAKKALIGDQPLGGIVGGVSKLAGGAGNLFKKALIGGGQQSAPTQQAPVQQQTAPVKKSPTKQQAPAKKTTGLAADKSAEDEEIQENRNIAKFVKCLSEKNYSQAHEYLKKVLNAKVEKNLHKVVNKI